MNPLRDCEDFVFQVDMGVSREKEKRRIGVTGDMLYKIYGRVFLTIGQFDTGQDSEATGLPIAAFTVPFQGCPRFPSITAVGPHNTVLKQLLGSPYSSSGALSTRNTGLGARSRRNENVTLSPLTSP